MGNGLQKRILLVDDEPRNLTVLEAHLQPLGHELVRATDGRAALEAFAAAPPDLMLLDLVMPGFDGLDVLTHIRAARDERAHIPIVLVTAHSDREHRLRGMEAGADEFLEKPVDAAILVARVRTLLALKESRDALAASRDELARRHAALEQAQREHRELMEFVVHDLKNPLSIVYSDLEWARENLSAPPAERADVLGDAVEAAGRVQSMIGDLLTISRMEQADFPLQREAIRLTKLLRAVIQSYVRRAAEGGITLVPPHDSDLEVRADRTLLQRVLENILDNAFRYTPARGRIAVAARADGGVQISISNDGPAIPAGERSHIFDKFRRGANERGATGNAGLGLYFCKRAIEAHGGVIDVVQTQDFATSFRIVLPESE